MIPRMMDGLKPSQRKILYIVMKQKIDAKNKEAKVAQLGNLVAKETAYKHGEKSLQEATINMAQIFVGSNNVNLLYPSGQFGTRPTGGTDHASERYTYTFMEE